MIRQDPVSVYCVESCPDDEVFVLKMASRCVTSIGHFAECILDSRKPETAGVADGLWTARMTAAAIQSRSTGEVVRF